MVCAVYAFSRQSFHVLWLLVTVGTLYVFVPFIYYLFIYTYNDIHNKNGGY